MVPTWSFGMLGLGALFFHQLKQRDVSVLLAGILLTLWGYVVYQEWRKKETQRETEQLSEINQIVDVPESYRMKSLPLAPVDAHFLPKKNSRYLRQNSVLVDLLKDLTFVKAFDKAAYYHLVLLMDRFQKIYIYLLVQRVRIQEGVPIFYDFYEAVLEHLYGFIVKVPVSLKHTYGLKPHERIHAQIEQFQGLFRTMVSILRNFAELELRLPYFPEWLPSSASLSVDRKNVLP